VRLLALLFDFHLAGFKKDCLRAYAPGESCKRLLGIPPDEVGPTKSQGKTLLGRSTEGRKKTSGAAEGAMAAKDALAPAEDRCFGKGRSGGGEGWGGARDVHVV